MTKEEIKKYLETKVISIPLNYTIDDDGKVNIDKVGMQNAIYAELDEVEKLTEMSN
jgi:hypothetical protein